MSDSQPTLDELFADGTEIDEALKEAARDARRLHKALGNPMATWIDGRIVWVQPEAIVVDNDPGRTRLTCLETRDASSGPPTDSVHARSYQSASPRCLASRPARCRKTAASCCPSRTASSPRRS